MEMYYKGGKLWAKGQGTPKQVMDFLNDCVLSQGQYDMVDEEFYVECKDEDR